MIIGLNYRRAVETDLPALVALLADDVLGNAREIQEQELGSCYQKAFAEITADPNQFLCVVESQQTIVGTLQITIIPGLSRRGARRGQIEAVRVAASRRGENIGQAMFAWAIEECRRRGCQIVQLTTDRSRLDAHRFYEKLGFEQSHFGYKLLL